MSNLSRRKFIQYSTVYSVVGGLLLSRMAMAEWPAAVFSKDKSNLVLQELFGDTNTEQSNMIEIKAPEIAENGAVVPISIKTNLPNVESVSILVDENPNPLAAHFVMQSGNNKSVGTRIKMAKPSKVTVIAKSNGKLYSSSKFVKVTKGGCGG